MSAVASGAPLSLAQIPLDQVIRLGGMTDEQLAVSLDPLPEGAPVAIRYQLSNSFPSPSGVIDDVLDRLQSIAIEMFPAWLPDAGVISTASDFDQRVVREMALSHAAQSDHFGPFLADMAEAAVRGRGPDRRLGPEVRARGLARIIAAGFGRGRVVLTIGPAEESSTEADQRGIAVAFEWLVNHGGIGVWLIAGALPLVDRYPTWQLSVPDYVDALSPEVPADGSRPVEYPALAGLPHPASAAEQTLERCLARCEWAAGRTWNQEYASHSLAPPIRVDLMWPQLRCVVEIDGPDHRGSLKYAADRRRDNGLVLDGFAVLRFTNEEIDDDPQQVLAVIRSLLSTKRNDEGNLT